MPPRKYREPQPADFQLDREELGGATSQLIARFKQLISEGKLRPGSKLPSERELARNFHVNRTTLRHALKMLEVMGVVSQRVGDGTYLNSGNSILLDEPLDFLIVLEDTSLYELFELRLLVEPELASRAALRAQPADLDKMRAAIDKMCGSRARQSRLKADADFHEAIFHASGMGVSLLIIRVLHRAIFRTLAHNFPGPVQLKRPIAHHQAILAAIAGHDPEAARQRMFDHLQDARAHLVALNRIEPGNS
jgi:GntR family transcriptional repressor for pyruvate dehydrogenase complex